MQRILQLLVGACLLLPAAASLAEVAPARRTPGTLKAQIEALRARKPAWREISWKSCLLEGLKESRARKKPALLWIFIDRPADDARC